ncbi:hypothetical protein BKA65DRAFT_107587 [Rhexocercosporidium sp. MPI-PUGE-AT-0058]|nr:hypothetical protein BKA65DRAFT_107587 [Rhexocercosporidium sp. MPI-PUGE-AT-0058]
MTQVGQIQPLDPTPWASPTPSSVQIQADADSMQIESTAESQVCRDDSIQRSTSPMDGISTELSALEDDDVQIIFCAPRRRKKRRRRFGNHACTSEAFCHNNRLGSTRTASPLGQICRPPTNAIPNLKIHHAIPQETPRRRSISVVQRLELCQLGENKSPSTRAGSLPSIPGAVNNSVSDMQYPWFAEPSYRGTLPSQFPSLTDSAAWLNQSLPILEPRPFLSIPWRPLQMEDLGSRKRKHEDEFDETYGRPSRLRQSVQMSPRTTPASAAILPLPFSVHNDSAQLDRFGLVQHPPSTPWPSTGWGTSENVGHNPNRSYSTRHSFVPMDLSDSDAAVLNQSLRQSSISNGFEQLGGSGTSLQHSGQTNGTLPPPNQNSMPPVQARHPTGQGSQVLLQSRSPVSRSNPHASSPPPGSLALNNMNHPHLQPPVAPPRPGVQARPLHASAPPILPRGNSRVIQSSDILRKPSLYSIPPWPSPSNLPAPPTHSATIQSHITSPIFSTNKSAGRTSEAVHSTLYHTGPSHQSNTTRSQNVGSETQAQTVGIPHAKAATPVSSSLDERFSPRVASFQIPKARLGDKHSPNMIVDVAETCQELFPFAEVAERHEVPIQKVFDTFSAIVQLPLLRNADDRRRHGSLGKRRMKEYRDAKKAMNKAQEAERKAQMKERSCRVEDTAKNAKEQSKPQGLLKSAVLNNAREVQRVE